MRGVEGFDAPIAAVRPEDLHVVEPYIIHMLTHAASPAAGMVKKRKRISLHRIHEAHHDSSVCGTKIYMYMLS